MAIPHGRIILAIASFGSIIQLSCGPRELSFQGRTAEQWVKLLGTSKSGTDNPLNIRQVITGEESNRITFEVAISYDLLQDNPKEKRLGKLALYIDGNDECLAQRATNGNCLLTWDKTYTAPGMHEAYAQLTISGRSGTRPLVIKGPVRSVSSSNAFQFDSFYSLFSNSRGAVLYARATSPTGAYAVRLYSPQGHHVRTISGTLSNGIVKAIWDLADEGGTIYTNDSIRAVFQVTGANSQLLTQTQTLYRAYP